MLFLCVPLMSSGLCRKYILCRSHHSYHDSLMPSGPVSVLHHVYNYTVCVVGIRASFSGGERWGLVRLHDMPTALQLMQTKHCGQGG